METGNVEKVLRAPSSRNHGDVEQDRLSTTTLTRRRAIAMNHDYELVASQRTND